MKIHRAFWTAAVLFVSIPAQMQASTPAAEKTTKPTESQLVKTIPAADANPSAPRKSHAFRVNDEKGLLLTCVAPKIDTDPNTDIFEDCALAPGRTLDDLMHTFVGAIHFEQNQHEQERAEWQKQLEEKDEMPAAKTAQK